MGDAPKSISSSGWKWLVVALVAVVAVTLALSAWLSRANGPVTYNAPNPVMPKPNGYDYFVAAGKALVDKDRIGDASSTSKEYRVGRPEVTQAERISLVRRNEKTLSLLHQGFKYDYMNPPVRSFSVLFPQYAQFRNVARLLSLQAANYKNSGNYSKAMDSYLDACEMGAKIPKGGSIITALVGMACEAIGRRYAWETVDRLPAVAARECALRLERIPRDQSSFAEVMTEEKYASAAGLAEEFNRPDWRSSFMEFRGDEPSNIGDFFYRLKLMAINRRAVVRDYVRYMDECISRSAKPYPARGDWPAIPRNWIVEMLVPVFAKAEFKVELNHAMDGLLCLSLALRAYKLEHGNYPSDLQALTPGYVTILPNDPFALSGTFRYRLKPGGYVLYSLGPDGKDDGGRPGDMGSLNSNESLRARHYMNYDSKGDIVAGINIM